MPYLNTSISILSFINKVSYPQTGSFGTKTGSFGTRKPAVSDNYGERNFAFRFSLYI